ncbi:hypothetical protein [Streptomyces sp. NPDC046805]|uniref:hypothetical protein n=1 Tax=Streptomyces sp. NPDC046805 TaxID=3155134 RepID=UPI0033C48E03
MNPHARPHGPQVANDIEHVRALPRVEIAEARPDSAAKLEVHNGPVTFAMEVTYNPNACPYVVLGGQITGGICGAPWDITGGFIGDTLRLDARRAGQGPCATTLTVVGEFQSPSAYRGTYGLNGRRRRSSTRRCTTADAL